MQADEVRYLSEEYLVFQDEVATWQEAITLAAQPLLRNHLIEEAYIAAMIDTVIKMGDYMVLVPKVALAHARPEAGAQGTGFSILKLTTPVRFGDTKEVNLIICLATKDNQAHIALLQKLSALIDEEEKVNALLATTTKQEFITLAETYITEEEAE